MTLETKCTKFNCPFLSLDWFFHKNNRSSVAPRYLLSCQMWLEITSGLKNSCGDEEQMFFFWSSWNSEKLLPLRFSNVMLVMGLWLLIVVCGYFYLMRCAIKLIKRSLKTLQEFLRQALQSSKPHDTLKQNQEPDLPTEGILNCSSGATHQVELFWIYGVIFNKFSTRATY